jgi:cytochrome b561
MALKKYNNSFVFVHWISTLILMLMLISGTFVLSELPNGSEKIAALQKHLLIGFSIGLITIIRLIMKTKHKEIEPLNIKSKARKNLISFTHVALYTVIFLIVFSGVVTSIMSGLGEVLFFGSTTPLPDDFGIYLPMVAHRVLVKALVALVGIHVIGVFYYLIKTDSAISSRMWFGNK